MLDLVKYLPPPEKESLSAISISSLLRPDKALTVILAKSLHASMHSCAPWVVLELSPAMLSARSMSGKYFMGTGARRMMVPLPADLGWVEPE